MSLSRRLTMRAMAPVLALCSALALAGLSLPGASLAEDCTFSLGFADLHDQIPDVVGNCLTDAEPQSNGDVHQPTDNGLLVWRSADNWTAFTNGTTTWINGPCGVQDRQNDERYVWEVFTISSAAADVLCGDPPRATWGGDFDPNAYIGQGDAYNCTNFINQAQAQAVLNADPSDPNKLDADHNGTACDSPP